MARLPKTFRVTRGKDGRDKVAKSKPRLDASKQIAMRNSKKQSWRPAR